MSETAIKVLGIGSRVKHPAMGEGVIIRLYKIAYDVCFFTYGIKQVAKDYSEWEIIEAIEPESLVSYTEAEKSLRKILREYSAINETVQIGDKWKDGMMILKPKDDSMKSKEIPIQTFFHKIVMVRDRVRVMEQRINSSKLLSDDDKVSLQQYITRIYGSMTTFNILFKYKDDHFKGESAK